MAGWTSLGIAILIVAGTLLSLKLVEQRWTSPLKASALLRLMVAWCAVFGALSGFGQGIDRTGFLSIGWFGLELMVAFVLFTWALFERLADWRFHFWAAFIVLIAISSNAEWLSDELQDRFGYPTWAREHARLLSSYAHRDGVLADWYIDGFAGSDVDAYIVADHGSDIRSKADAMRWLASRKINDCQVTKVEKVDSQIYVLRTFNCVFNPVLEERRWYGLARQ